jgi:hypothetical protein
MRRFWDRPLGAKIIALLALVLLVLWIAAPWQRTCNTTAPGDAICGYRFAWQGHDSGWLIGLFGLAVLLWEVLPVAVTRLSMRGWPAAVVQACLSLALVVVTLTKLIVDNEFQQEWAWVTFGVSLVILITAVLRVRWRWDHRRRERLEADLEVARAEAARPAATADPDSRP